MREQNPMNNQNINDRGQAQTLRQEAEMPDYKGYVRNRLHQLMEISQDPFYDQYLAQMMKDLDSGRATPAQVEREAKRSYDQYRERMAQKAMAEVHARRKQTAPAEKSSVEFKVGAHVFGFLGAVFILVAFVIFGFNFLDEMAQGLCLYGAALVLVLLSELLFGKRIPGFSYVLTGIGIGGLYAANIVNYLVLHTINGIAAMALTLLIALGMLFIGRKKDSAAIRLVSLIGCYISFWPIDEFETEFNFLIAAAVLFIINAVSIFLKNQKHQLAIDLVHVFLNIFSSIIFISAAWREELNPAYLVFYVVTSFIFYSILCLKRSKEKNSLLFAFGCVGNGISIFMLFLIGNMAPGVSDLHVALYVHLLAEVLILAVCGVIFLLWDKADGRKWAQVYYIAAVVLLMSLMSAYPLERILSVLSVLLLGKILAGQKEMQVLDCIAVMWTGLMGLWLSDYWYCWLFAGALLLSAFRIMSMHIYHEIVITLSILAIWWSQCEFYLSRSFGFDNGWLYPVSAGILLLLFLLFNHLPKWKNEHQKAYNISNVVFMLGYYLGVWLCDDYIISSVMMILGVATIIVVFRKRYEMAVPRKDLLIAGFLAYFSVTGHYESPVIVSVLLMAVALFCVGIGFKMQDKKERVCGLTVALFICIKLVLYDFREVEVLYRVIVFLVVGLIALIISYIYIQLEKSMENKNGGFV